MPKEGALPLIDSDKIRSRTSACSSNTAQGQRVMAMPMDPADSPRETRLAWLALASRAPVDEPMPLDPEVLAHFVDGQCGPDERARVLAALANDPVAWATWRTLLAERDAATVDSRAPAEKARWYLRWFQVSMLPRWGMATALCLVAFAGVRLYLPTGHLGGALPTLAGAWLEQIGDAALERIPLASSPFVRVGRSGPIIGPVTPSAEESRFRQGFQRGQVAVLEKLAMNAPEWQDTTRAVQLQRDTSCDSGECGAAYDSGVTFGVWASSTALRCGTQSTLVVPVADLAELRGIALSRGAGVPNSLPKLPGDDANVCLYASRLTDRYAVIP